jgi:hypothetical protein
MAAQYILLHKSNSTSTEWKAALNSNNELDTDSNATELLERHKQNYSIDNIKIAHLQTISESYTIEPTA